MIISKWLLKMHKNPLSWDRFKDKWLYEYNPNAEMPRPVMLGDGLIFGNGKLWDDSEVSDEEMDSLIARQNAINGCVRFFNP